MRLRDLGNNPRVLDKLRQQGKLPESPASGRASAQNRLKAAIKTRDQAGKDTLFLYSESKSISAIFHGAILVTNNVLLRVGDKQASQYKNYWAKRVEDLRLGNIELWRSWRNSKKYPLVADLLYRVPHGNHMDCDGLTGAGKYLVDAFRHSKFLTDDSPAYLHHVLPLSFTGEQTLVITFRPSPHQYGYVSEHSVRLLNEL